jgi:hypothetical protein
MLVSICEAKAIRSDTLLASNAVWCGCDLREPKDCFQAEKRNRGYLFLTATAVTRSLELARTQPDHNLIQSRRLSREERQAALGRTLR